MAKSETRPVRWDMACKAIPGLHGVVGGGTLGRFSEISTGDLPPGVTGGRSQSHRSTDGLQEQTGPTRTGNGAQTKVWITGVRPLCLNIGRRLPEKRGVGKPRQERVVGKWMRNVQKERQA